MNEKKIWEALLKLTENKFGAAGLMGNLYAESALNPKNLQNSYEKTLGYTDDSYTAAVDSGRYKNFTLDSAGYGLAQWTFWSRKEGLLKLATKKGTSIGDLDTQLEYLAAEITEHFPTVLKALKTATSVAEASDIVLKDFEATADQGEKQRNTRRSYSEKYYDKYANVNETDGIVINQNLNFGTHNTSVRKGSIEYIVIHYVGAIGGAKDNIDYYNNPSTQSASADFYVGFAGNTIRIHASATVGLLVVEGNRLTEQVTI